MFLLIISLLNKLWVNSDEYVLTSVHYTLGGLIFYLQPLLNVPGFQWKLQAFFYIYCRYAPHILYICIWLFSIFLLSPYSNEIFMLRLQGVPISYPQLCWWISMKISDILLHTLEMYTQRLCKCYMRFDYFQLFWFPILKNGFCHTILEGVPITYPLSLLDLWMDFNETCVNQLQNGKI